MELTPSQCLTITGLILDIFGAMFIGFEVFNRYKGQLVEQSWRIEDVDDSRPVLCQDYQDWERRKYIVMSIGLGFLLLGFVLQILGALDCPGN